ncbi:MAG: hypothetical protein QXR58_01875 [Candidatus Micrarchaeaceae archaeon]
MVFKKAQLEHHLPIYTKRGDEHAKEALDHVIAAFMGSKKIVELTPTSKITPIYEDTREFVGEVINGFYRVSKALRVVLTSTKDVEVFKKLILEEVKNAESILAEEGAVQEHLGDVSMLHTIEENTRKMVGKRASYEDAVFLYTLLKVELKDLGKEAEDKHFFGNAPQIRQYSGNVQ